MTQASGENHEHLGVFEHQKRREWGLGILAWEKSNRRGYVFENGHVRVLAEPFYALMREVDRPLDEVRALYKCLKPELDAARAEHGSEARTPRDTAVSMSFDDQVRVFRSEFPGGFNDARWLEKQRGREATKRLATHRDAALVEAQEQLGARSLKARVAAHEYPAVHREILAVLKRTDLVPATELAAFDNGDPERQRTLVLAVLELLHGKGDFGTRLSRFLSAFQDAVGQPAGWHLATALPALVDPAEHVCIRPSVFRAQAKWMAPRLTIPKSPTAASYLRCQAMAKLISNKLVDSETPPRDMMDVHDFIRVTARPEAKRRLSEMKRAQ